MSSIPANVIMIWTSTNATIPSGWSRETTLDGRFPKGAAASTQGGTNGGAATHTHTSTTHTHSISTHTHTGTTVGDGVQAVSTDYAAAGIDCSPQNHTHTFTSDGTSGTSSASSAITWSSPSNNPAFRKVIYIKASAGASLATDIVALYNSNTPPSNWTNVTELSGRFMQGAATDADADLVTDNGSDTHTHTSTHNHTLSHNHTGTTGTASDAGTRESLAGSNTASPSSHTHTFTLSTANETSDTYNATTASGSNVPAYAILQAIKKGASGAKAIGIIGLWLEAIASIPRGWVLCDGTNGTKDLREKHIKIGDPAGANGGANTHGHAAVSHTHNANASHTHTSTTSNQSTLSGEFNNTGTLYGNNTHAHTISTTQAQTTALASGDIPATSSSDSNEPEYRTVNFIEFQKETYGGAFLFNMIN